MAGPLDWLQQILGGQPPPSSIDQAPSDTGPRALQYLQDVMSGKIAADALPNTYDPSRSFAANVRDPQGLQQAMDVAMGVSGPGLAIKAYHGSPHDFERFDMSKIGTGEGAQAYGHGLYFAENEGVAKGYRDALSGNLSAADGAAYSAAHNKAMDLQQELSGLHDLAVYHSVNKGMPLDKDWGEIGMQYHPDIEALFRPKMDRMAAERDAALTQAQDILQNAHRAPGRMYEAQINAEPEHFLDWDKRLSEQPANVRDAVNRVGRDPGVGLDRITDDMRGPDLLSLLKNPEATAALRQRDVPGIRYLDQGSRNAVAEQMLREDLRAGLITQAEFDAKTKATSNYVVFDDKLIEILRKYGIVPPLAAGAAGGGLLGAGSEPPT